MTATLTGMVVMVGCVLAGFYIGRNVLGEQYLKAGAAKLRMPPAPNMAQQTPAPPEPVIEEAPSAAEEQEPQPAPRTERRHEAPSVAPETPAPRGTAPSASTVQLGAFLDPNNAKALVQDLRNRGYSPTVTTEKQGQTTLHRVTMGPLTQERARSLASDLQREGFEASIAGAGKAGQ